MRARSLLVVGAMLGGLAGASADAAKLRAIGIVNNSSDPEGSGIHVNDAIGLEVAYDPYPKDPNFPGVYDVISAKLLYYFYPRDTTEARCLHSSDGISIGDGPGADMVSIYCGPWTAHGTTPTGSWGVSLGEARVTLVSYERDSLTPDTDTPATLDFLAFEYAVLQFAGASAALYRLPEPDGALVALIALFALRRRHANPRSFFATKRRSSSMISCASEPSLRASASAAAASASRQSRRRRAASRAVTLRDPAVGC